jgi:hypothetical protein
MQNPKIREYCMWQSNIFLQLAKELLIPFRAVAKNNQIPFRANCIGNLRIACNADNVGNSVYRWENFIKKLKKAGKIKIMFIIRGFYTHESLSNHTTFRPIKSGATVPFSRSKLSRLDKSCKHFLDNFFYDSPAEIAGILRQVSRPRPTGERCRHP